MCSSGLCCGRLPQPSQYHILGPTYPKVMLISDRDGEVSFWALLVLQLFKCFAYHTIIAPTSDYWHHQHQLLMGSELLWVHGIAQDAKRYQMQAQKEGGGAESGPNQASFWEARYKLAWIYWCELILKGQCLLNSRRTLIIPGLFYPSCLHYSNSAIFNPKHLNLH